VSGRSTFKYPSVEILAGEPDSALRSVERDCHAVLVYRRDFTAGAILNPRLSS
jgi:hypothetical protein